MTNGDNVRKMTDKELETLFNNIEYYAKRCEDSDWYKCDTCDCPWCDREGDVDFGKWLKQQHRESGQQMLCRDCANPCKYGYHYDCPNYKSKDVGKQTNYDWLSSLPIEKQAEAIANLVFKATGEYNRERYPSNRWFKKEYWLKWLKQPHIPQKQDDYPCNVKGCSLETRQACCGCPDYFEWEKQHKE